MSLKESEEAIRERYKTAMDKGRMTETPSAVIAETDRLTSKIISKITHKYARRKDKRVGFTDITAASIVEQELIQKLRNP